jgi:hypothetical protein
VVVPKQPVFPLYTGDWLKDPDLSKCSPATRGIWIDVLCAMHESDRRGILEGTAEQLSRVLRCGPADVTRAVRELKETGAANVEESNGAVTLVNRRMQREYEERVATRNRVRKHRYGDDVTEDVTDEKRESNAHSSSSSSERPVAAQPGGAGRSANNAKSPDEPSSAKFPSGVWRRASDGWSAAFRHVHGSDFHWNSRQARGLRDVLVALKADLGKFERVAKAWLLEPESGKAKGHPLYQLAEDLNYIESKIAKGTVGKTSGANGRAGEETPEQYAHRVAAKGN